MIFVRAIIFVKIVNIIILFIGNIILPIKILLRGSKNEKF